MVCLSFSGEEVILQRYVKIGKSKIILNTHSESNVLILWNDEKRKKSKAKGITENANSEKLGEENLTSKHKTWVELQV